ncbi:hypothetical protein TNCV_4615611 [Trichonephila clavipes]|nr:hypothetical protein TNCV_4615611 [Trichonephila clavipes]
MAVDCFGNGERDDRDGDLGMRVREQDESQFYVQHHVGHICAWTHKEERTYVAQTPLVRVVGNLNSYLITYLRFPGCGLFKDLGDIIYQKEKARPHVDLPHFRGCLALALTSPFSGSLSQ